MNNDAALEPSGPEGDRQICQLVSAVEAGPADAEAQKCPGAPSNGRFCLFFLSLPFLFLFLPCSMYLGTFRWLCLSVPVITDPLAWSGLMRRINE